MKFDVRVYLLQGQQFARHVVFGMRGSQQHAGHHDDARCAVMNGGVHCFIDRRHGKFQITMFDQTLRITSPGQRYQGLEFADAVRIPAAVAGQHDGVIVRPFVHDLFSGSI